MREILFRGKTYDGKWKQEQTWVYGDLLQDGYDYDVAIWNERYKSVDEVIPETVGQYTGLTDKNGKKIFEGDIVAGALLEIERPVNSVVTFHNGSFGVLKHRKTKEHFFRFESMFNVRYEVIGNIHDNPELLKE